ncbi:MAG: ABC transporter ATP-binding protein [Armatimonadetes bacterium]|nr:ABC transporter ATP-binding protein [Armatimonadota bacterium]
MIKVRNLVYRVAGRTILDGISFDVARHSCLGVMGMSGTGKSTLLKNIMGLLRPVSGDIIVDGQSIVGLTEQQLAPVRRKMGMCFQYAALFDSLTVRENVAFALRRHTQMTDEEIEQRVAEVLERVGMRGTENLYPAELSGGMRKRVGIARALAPQPQVMLYDEPSSGLDPITAARLDRLLRSLDQEEGMTSVVVTHDVRELFEICDVVMMLHEGRIVAMDTPEGLAASKDPLVRQFVEGSPDGPIGTQAI